MLKVFLVIAGSAIVLRFLHLLSYKYLKNKIIRSRKWDLNICCGKTDGGGINADIYRHEDLPNFVQVNDIYNLPFRDKQFNHTLCSHTIEHVDDPVRFFNELKRVSEEVTLILPPLWDIGAALDIMEHKYIFLTLTKKHTKLPVFIKFPFASFVQRKFGQINHA